MAWYNFKIDEEFLILRRIHPKADVYFMRVAVAGGVILILQMLTQIMTAISLLE